MNSGDMLATGRANFKCSNFELNTSVLNEKPELCCEVFTDQWNSLPDPSQKPLYRPTDQKSLFLIRLLRFQRPMITNTTNARPTSYYILARPPFWSHDVRM
jgi:hypothetical protein